MNCKSSISAEAVKHSSLQLIFLNTNFRHELHELKTVFQKLFLAKHRRAYRGTTIQLHILNTNFRHQFHELKRVFQKLLLAKHRRAYRGTTKVIRLQRGQMLIVVAIVEYQTPMGSNLCLNLKVSETFFGNLWTPTKTYTSPSDYFPNQRHFEMHPGDFVSFLKKGNC